MCNTNTSYGKECIIDLSDCFFPTRQSIEDFCIALCNLIDMEREDIYFWDYDGYPEEYEAAPNHLKGISAVQFIKTSSIVIHSLDAMRRIYLNIFSCKDFDEEILRTFVLARTGGRIQQFVTIDRK